MQVEIITPDRTLFEGEAESVSLPGTDGRFQILNNHAPIVASLTHGNVVLKTGGKSETIQISGGVVEVLSNKIVVLA
jgi:F-type H+-transporting ATPase subunit epsilon